MSGRGRGRGKGRGRGRGRGRGHEKSQGSVAPSGLRKLTQRDGSDGDSGSSTAQSSTLPQGQLYVPVGHCCSYPLNLHGLFFSGNDGKETQGIEDAGNSASPSFLRVFPHSI